MKNYLTKNTLRSLFRTKGRFISILAIIAIGCAFFSGIKACSGYMKNSSYRFLDGQSAADIRIRSTLGFSDDDIDAVRDNEYIASAYTGCSADLFLDRGTENLIVSVYSYEDDMALNKLKVIEGRLPEKEDECVADYAPYRCGKFAVGDRITLTADADTDISDVLNVTEYTVVGLVQSPMYVAQEKGASALGNGVVNAFMYVPSENFAYSSYTDIYAVCADTEGVNCFSDEYYDIADKTVTSLEDLSAERIEKRSAELRSDFDEETADAEADLADGEKKYSDGMDEYDKGFKKIKEAYAELDEKQKELDVSREELDKGLSDFEDAQKSLGILVNTCADIDSIINEYSESYVHTLPDELADRLNAIQQAYDDFEIDVNIRDMLSMYIITDPRSDSYGKTQMRRNISSANEQVRSQSSHFALEIQNTSAVLNDSEKHLSDGQKQINDARREIEENEKTLNESKTELDDARAEIDQGYQDLEEAKADFDELISGGEWYVQDRDDAFPYYSSYADDCERVDSIAAVFPLFFILIAALVCICTMTRMIDEQRTEIGTFKALGFSSANIGMQYIMYAAAASFLGSTVGVLAGLKVIPQIIYTAYCSMYNFPYIETPFKWSYYLGCLGVSLLCTAVSSGYACKKTLSDRPAQLMRPRPPKSGKRVFLEKLPFIWKHLGFSLKVSFRNLFRYKSRFFMSVLGIAGCTALLLAGVSLKHSIACIVDRQFGQLFTYEAAAVIDDGCSEEELAEALDIINNGEYTESSLGAYQAVKDVRAGDSTFEDCNILSPEDINEFGAYIDIHERKSGMKLYIPKDGAVITEKLSEVLGVGVGDEITVEDGLMPLKISGIAENYVNNYIYIDKNICAEVFGENESNIIMMKLAEGYDSDAISKELLKCGAVLAVTYTADGGSKFSDLIASMDLVVALIIVFSGALAFVVLFNLAVINVNERVHELATLKVLGFYDGEVSSYIYRENVFSTILGIIPGLPLGIALLKFVLKYAEVNSVMFARDIPAYCYAAAALTTAIFAALVNIVMHFRLKSIDMAASLKAIE